MGNDGSKMFIEVGKEMAKAAIKVLTEGEAAPDSQTKVRSFVSTVLNLPDSASEADLERAITELDPNDDISSNAERFIRAASIYIYTQRSSDALNTDFWIACRECLVRLGFDDSAVDTMCATPSGDETIQNFCKQLAGCDFHKSVCSVGAELSLWKITKEALKLLELYLENQKEEGVAGQAQTQAAVAW